MPFRSSFVALLAVVTSACVPGDSSMSQEEASALTDTLRTLTTGYHRALSSLDPEATTAYYDTHPDFRLYSDGQRITRQDVTELLESFPSSLQSLTVRLEDIEITLLGRDAGLAAYRFERDMVVLSGDTIQEWGTATMVWVRRSHGWRAIHAHGVHYPRTLTP